MPRWLLLVYKIPREPTAGRVYVWRKLKQVGAVPLQDAVWVLPSTPRTKELFQWLAAEISELQGESHFWEAEQLYATNPAALERQFSGPVETEYRAILAALKTKRPDLASLSKRYQQAAARDFFQLPLGNQVRDRLLAVQDEGKR